ncbi:MAG: hypothetical protein XU15_C0011G0126 [candidate division NC10 bacterium CSP1-5]|nr:MAG: hypothetical protein XU15_C0011G0126 [candidate division NC10 bacterium CSP1-5]
MFPDLLFPASYFPNGYFPPGSEFNETVFLTLDDMPTLTLASLTFSLTLLSLPGLTLENVPVLTLEEEPGGPGEEH